MWALSHPPAFLLPAWTSQQLTRFASTHPRSSKKANASKGGGTPSSPTIKYHGGKPIWARRKGASRPRTEVKPHSLYSELFPSEVEILKHTQAQRQTTFERLPPLRWLPKPSIPRLPAEDFRVRRVRPSDPKPDRDVGRGMSGAPATHVLALHRLSRTLEKSDFVRLSPKGRHIEGWTQGLDRVVQVRHPVTLEATGSYYLIFDTAMNCEAYRAAVQRLQDISRMSESQSNIKGLPIKPPAHLIADMDDWEASIENFTLLPTPHARMMSTLPTSREPELERLLQHGLPDLLIPWSGLEGRIVLLCSALAHVKEQELRDALKADGRRRNMPWNLAGKRGGVRRLLVRKGQPFRKRAVDETLDGAGDRPAAPSFPAPSRFVLTFEDNGEARRFVRAWHRRPLRAEQTPDRLSNVDSSVVTAEIIE